MNKRTTIFKQLILNIVIPAIIALLALGIVNLKQTWGILKDSSDNKNRIITEEIKQLHEMQDMAMRILEMQLDPILEGYSNALVNDIFASTEGIEEADLFKIREKIGMDVDNEDIYIINREGIVVNTTFKADQGMNLFDFGTEHKEMLNSVWESKKFFSDIFTLEQSTKNIKKYTYIPTHDGKYLIELGVRSDQAEAISRFVKERMNKMSEVQSNIISADLFIGRETPLCINGDAGIDEENLDSYLSVMENHEQVTIKDRKSNPPLRIDFIFMYRENTSLYSESIIRIKSDIREELAVFRNELIKFFGIFSLAVIIVVILLYRKTRVITDPIKKLVSNVNRITAGHLNERAEVIGNNEIASLSEQFNDMISQLESYYNDLEEKVKERTAEVVAQKEEIEAQRDTLREQRNLLSEVNDNLKRAYTEIEDSIHYASRIQNAILPPDDYLSKVLPNAFFFYRPRDIVSGDFYWVAAKDGKIIVAAVDCTGHGVPGAFMSIVGNNQLNYALNVEEATQPSEMLRILDEGVTSTLRQNKNRSVQDGMDLAMVTIDPVKKTVQYAGAFNPLIMVRDGELSKIKADRVPIGGHFIEADKKLFTHHEFEYKDGDMIYLYSDGFADQFGGPKGGKYMTGKFVKLLNSISEHPVSEQYSLLEKELFEWMGGEFQIDDILVIGIRL